MKRAARNCLLRRFNQAIEFGSYEYLYSYDATKQWTSYIKIYYISIRRNKGEQVRNDLIYRSDIEGMYLGKIGQDLLYSLIDRITDSSPQRAPLIYELI